MPNPTVCSSQSTSAVAERLGSRPCFTGTPDRPGAIKNKGSGPLVRMGHSLHPRPIPMAEVGKLSTLEPHNTSYRRREELVFGEIILYLCTTYKDY